ncbi:MAG: protein-glutamate O-methyltransferase CheR [Candidatus Thermoplasmatota archaeon]
MLDKPFDQEFQELKANVKQLLDFNTFQYKDTYLGRRFDSRLRALHIDSYHAYWEFLKKDKAEQEKLLQELTINVTEFFRDNTVYDAFKTDVIPTILAEKKGTIRVWSAGSSDGKEAYSIAMLFSEVLGEQNLRNRVEILGTDIDRDCLNHATQGVYHSRPGIIQTDIEKQIQYLKNYQKYFTITDTVYEIKPSLKSIVRFEYHDLISGPKKHNIDIIFCRNVVIYFTRELQEVLYDDFYNTLNPGGFFVMGKTETLVGNSRDKFKPFNLRERIFRK